MSFIDYVIDQTLIYLEKNELHSHNANDCSLVFCQSTRGIKILYALMSITDSDKCVCDIFAH